MRRVFTSLSSLLLFHVLFLSGQPTHAARDRSEQKALARAQVLEKQGAYEQAAKYYQTILRDFPSSFEARRGLSRDLAKIGHCDEAAGVLKTVSQPGEDQGERETEIGVCYFHAHHFAQAISHLERATELAPKSKEARIFLSRAYDSMARPKDAVELLKAGLARNPDDVDLLYWIGRHYNGLAELTYQNMAKTNPDHYLVHELDGDQLRLKQEYDKALEAYGKALRAAPYAPGIHFKLGDIYWRLLKFDEAKRELRSELQINPFHAQAHFELGDIDIKQRNFREGISYLERALKLDPKLLEAHRSLGKGLLAEKQYDKALHEFSLVARAHPGDQTIHALLANAYRQMGRTEESEEETRIYEKLIKEKGAQLQQLKVEEQRSEAPSPPPPKN